MCRRCKDVVSVVISMESVVCDCRVWSDVFILFFADIRCYSDFPGSGVVGDLDNRRWLLLYRVGPYNVELGFCQWCQILCVVEKLFLYVGKV